ncbi:hypothetical protein [Tunturiibacter gelidiferens]|uniref:hypothetical protein n=1 Tax=Tunturiibacter gelidiferens TaxID=3069689 RepID=UPI003D9B5328
MSKLGCIRLIAGLSIGLFAGSLFAQTSSDDQTSTSAHPPVESSGVNAEDAVQASNGGGEQKMQYAAALDGTGLISMDRTTPTHLLLGVAVAGGWDSNPDNLGNGASSGVYILSPYFGIQVSTPKTQYLLQYQPTITGYSSSIYSRETMNVASATIAGTVNERWSWDLSARGTYGQDSLRLLAPQQSVAVGEVPGNSSSSASYLPNAGTVTYANGDLDIHYRKSERDSLEFHVANSFSHFTGMSENNGVATTERFGYGRELSSKLGVIAYGQSSYINGFIDCASFGGGIGLKWQAGERTSLSLSGGPQFDTSACGNQLEFSYNAAFSTRLSSKSQIYLLASRQPTASYLGPQLSQLSVSGGYQRRITTNGTLSLDIGYARSDTLATGSSYHETYFGCIYGYRIGHGFSATYTYRGYVGDSNGTKFTRNLGLFSLTWTPGAGRVFQ